MTEANNRKLKGYVKNLATGEVYIEVHGEEQAIHSLIEWCHDGPRFATVSEVKVEHIPFEDLSEFEIRY